jgi:hypothetical protein
MALGVKEYNDFYLLQPELLNETTLKQVLELVSIKCVLMCMQCCELQTTAIDLHSM